MRKKVTEIPWTSLDMAGNMALIAKKYFSQAAVRMRRQRSSPSLPVIPLQVVRKRY